MVETWGALYWHNETWWWPWIILSGRGRTKEGSYPKNQKSARSWPWKPAENIEAPSKWSKTDIFVLEPVLIPIPPYRGIAVSCILIYPPYSEIDPQIGAGTTTSPSDESSGPRFVRLFTSSLRIYWRNGTFLKAASKAHARISTRRSETTFRLVWFTSNASRVQKRIVLQSGSLANGTTILLNLERRCTWSASHSQSENRDCDLDLVYRNFRQIEHICEDCMEELKDAEAPMFKVPYSRIQRQSSGRRRIGHTWQ